jgi:beta-lysine 5,6-aminomutase beta subunit
MTAPATPKEAAASARASAPQDIAIRPYGDTMGDGMAQVSFTLPVPHGRPAEGAALQLATKMGLTAAMVVLARPIGTAFTFFVVYGRLQHQVYPADVTVPEGEFPLLSPQEVNQRIRRALGRPLVVVGACIGTDAHTVGIDAILNIKGFAGQKGLEYYREITVHNLGAQVKVAELLACAREFRADAVLVSQIVTQRDTHLLNTREMTAEFTKAYAKESRPLLVVGGPRFAESESAALGVDKVFTRGTTPGEVASYLAHALTVRKTGAQSGQA